MQLIVFLQSIQGYTNNLLTFVKIVAGTAFLIYLVWGGFRVFKEFSDGNGDQAKTKAINLIVGAVIFAIVVSNLDNLTTMIVGANSNVR